MPKLGENSNFTRNFDPSFHPTALYIQWNTESSRLSEITRVFRKFAHLGSITNSVEAHEMICCILHSILLHHSPLQEFSCIDVKIISKWILQSPRSSALPKLRKPQKYPNITFHECHQASELKTNGNYSKRLGYMRTHQSLQSPPSALWSGWRFQPSLDLCLGWSPQKLQTWISVQQNLLC